MAAHGEGVWREIRRRAGVEDELFISNQDYPDEVTYRLVGAASELLQQPVETLLHKLGEHWVLHTALRSFGAMMAAGGNSLGEFLENLPVFHDRVALLYPKLVPPRFEISDRAEGSLRLHYFSDRAGLTAFVGGLISGLGRMFSTPARSTLLQSRARGADHDVFLVEWER